MDYRNSNICAELHRIGMNGEGEGRNGNVGTGSDLSVHDIPLQITEYSGSGQQYFRKITYFAELIILFIFATNTNGRGQKVPCFVV